jgi:hypothetical protein
MASELVPQDAAQRSKAGLACVRAGDHEEGLRFLREAADQAPSDFAITRRLVKGLVEAGQPDEAERVIQVARFAFPRCGRLLGLLGKLRGGQIRAAEAQQADEGPTILPFLRVEGPPPRRDTMAATLAGPHLVRLRRRSAMGRPS